MKKILKIVASLLLVLVTSTFLFAQVSNTYDSTAGTLRDDADNFMDLRYFNEVDFSNFFVWTDLSADSIDLGFAKKVKDVYIGAYYNGYLWDTSLSEEITNLNNNELNSFLKEVSFENYLDLLFGFNGMGLKLSTGFDIYEDQEVTTTSSEKNKNSSYFFDLGWGGLSIPVDKFTIYPHVMVGYSFNDETNISSNKIGDTVYTRTDISSNLGILSFNFGADMAWGDKAGFYSETGLDYSLGIGIMPKDRILEDTGTNEIQNRVGGVLAINYFTPYYRFEYSASEQVKFGGKIQSELLLLKYTDGTITTSADGMTSDIDINDIYNITSVEHYIDFGMQYQVKPAFAINFGFSFNIPSVIFVKVISTDTVTRGHDTGYFSSSLSTGFVWDINEKCALDANLNISVSPSILNDILNNSMSLGFKYKM